VARFEAGGVECVSGPQEPHGEDDWSRRIAMALRTRLGIGGASFRNPRDEIEVDTAFTGVWLRSTLIGLGGWDEAWPINEDAELAARIRERGGRYVSIPEMAARYVPRRSLGALALQYWRYGKYREKTARAHPIGLRRSHILPPGVVLVTACALLAPPQASRRARRGLTAYGAGGSGGEGENPRLGLATGRIRDDAPELGRRVPVRLPAIRTAPGCARKPRGPWARPARARSVDSEPCRGSTSPSTRLRLPVFMNAGPRSREAPNDRRCCSRGRSRAPASRSATSSSPFASRTPRWSGACG
jgi:hypothetical protein